MKTIIKGSTEEGIVPCGKGGRDNGRIGGICRRIRNGNTLGHHLARIGSRHLKSRDQDHKSKSRGHGITDGITLRSGYRKPSHEGWSGVVGMPFEFRTEAENPGPRDG